MRHAALLAAVLSLAVSIAAAGDRLPPINVNLAVAEWGDVDRQSGAAWGGVPLAPRLIKNVNGLALVDDQGRPVPAQFAPLVTDRDAWVRWVLVDCQLDLAAGRSKTFTLKTGENPAPKDPLQVQRAGDLIQVTTGPMRFAVDTRRYNFLDTVWIDANGDGRFDKGERVVVPTGTPNVVAVDAETGVIYTSLGATPKTVRFEYRGPLRAVMVMEGQLADALGRNFLGYRTRITAFAGQSLLLVEHSLRNSRKEKAFDARIRRAELALGLAEDVTQYHLGRDLGRTVDGTLLEGDEVVLQQAAPDKKDSGAFLMTLTGRQGPKQLSEGRGAPGWAFASSGSRGVFLFDRDFEPAGPKRLVQRWGRLVLEDVPESQPFLLSDLTCRVARVALDFAARPADKIEPAALMARVRAPLVLRADPAYLARSGALGGPFATLEDEIKVYQDVWKWKWDERRKPARAVLPPVVVEEGPPHLGRTDALRDALLELVRTGDRHFFRRSAELALRWEYGVSARTDGFDFKGGSRKKALDPSSDPTAGLVDWYCLTGDVEALEAAVDVGEQSDQFWERYVPGKDAVHAGAPLEGFGLSLAGLCRLYEATYEPRWLKVVEHMVRMVDQNPARSESGALDGLAYTKEAAPSHSAAASLALWRVWTMADSETARDMVVGLAHLVQKERQADVRYVDGLARGYDLTGDMSFLGTAKDFWARDTAAKPPPKGALGGPGTTVGLMLQDGDDRIGTRDAYARLFFWYLAHPREDGQPPKRIIDLAVTSGPNKTSVYLTWTAPADQGGGEVAVYQVKEAALPLVEYQDFDYEKDQGKKRNWWFAANLTGEPKPAKPGTRERFLVKDLAPGTHYFALKSRDGSSNESAMSNVVKVEIAGPTTRPK
jgi:hypothetical protein